jgi:hypothetical protein
MKTKCCRKSVALLLLLAGGVLQAQTINQQMTVEPGASYTIKSVTPATGATAYQWLENGIVIPNATAASYTNAVGKASPGRFEYIRRAIPSGCTDYINSNTFVVNVTYNTPPNAASTNVWKIGNKVISDVIAYIPQCLYGKTVTSSAAYYYVENDVYYYNYSCIEQMPDQCGSWVNNSTASGTWIPGRPPVYPAYQSSSILYTGLNWLYTSSKNLGSPPCAQTHDDALSSPSCSRGELMTLRCLR